jgi:hypothetical protein
MDARVDVSEGLEIKLLSRYALGRKARDPAFDPAKFAARYMVLGAQRSTKILGIFARLDRRDRKPGYLQHMPRVWRYLMGAFAHPVLADLKTWYAANVPPPIMPEAIAAVAEALALDVPDEEALVETVPEEPAPEPEPVTDGTPSEPHATSPESPHQP